MIRIKNYLVINNILIVNNKLIKYFFAIFTISQIFSIFVTELLSFLLIIFFLFNSSWDDKSLYFKNYIIKFLCLFCLIIIISSIFSDHYLFSLKSSLPYARYIFFCISVSWLINKNEKNLDFFVYFLFFALLILSLSGLYEYLIKNSCEFVNSSLAEGYVFKKGQSFFCNKYLFVGNTLRLDRLSGFFGDELIIGSFLSRTLPLFFALYFLFYNQVNKNLSKNKIYLFLFLIILTIIFSGERLAFVYLIIFFIIYLYIETNNIKNFFIIIFLSVIILSFIIYLNPTAKKRLFNQSFSQITNTFDAKDNEVKKINFFSKEHAAHAIVAINIFKDNVFLGSGPKTFRKLCKDKKFYIKDGCATHPHNTYLQLLSETGSIGTIIPFSFLLLIVIGIYQILVKKFKNTITLSDKSKLFFLTSFMISLFPILPSGNFFNNWISFIYFFPLGFYLNFFLVKDLYKNKPRKN